MGEDNTHSGESDDDNRQGKKEDHNSTTIRKREVLNALEAALGIVTAACEMSGIHRSTFYEWCKEDPAFKKEVDDMQNIALDFAESSLHKQIEKGVPASTIFYLKTKGKKRGYVERVEHTGIDGDRLGVDITVTPKEKGELDGLMDSIEQDE